MKAPEAETIAANPPARIIRRAPPLVVPDPHKDVPSILEQTDWPCGYFRTPPRHKTQYFNPGLVDWIGARWLVARRRRYTLHPGTNDIVFFRLRGTEIASEHQIKFRVRFTDEHWEDPRAIIWQGNPWVSYSNFRTRHPHVHQAAATITRNLQAIDYHPVYGANGSGLMMNRGNEKNWLWFVNDNRLHFVYSPDPHIVVGTGTAGAMEEHAAPGIQWLYGRARGGTPPVFVPEDALYWSFFHSSLDISPTPPRRRYYMGAYAFDPMPPFKPVMATREPFLIGSGQDPRELSAPYCVFPCGALLDGGEWLVSLGVNDCACAWIKIPHQELRRLSYLV